MKYSIYALSNPITGEVFYVGKTINLKTRFKSHLSLKDADNVFKNQIIEYILHNSAMPIIEEIDSFDCVYCEDEDYVNELEVYWMHQLTAWGFKLTNIDGLRRKTKPGRRYAHVLKESGFEFIKRDMVEKTNKLKELKEQVLSNAEFSKDQKKVLALNIKCRYNYLFSSYNSIAATQFDMLEYTNEEKELAIANKSEMMPDRYPNSNTLIS